MSFELRDALYRYFNPTWDEHLGWENARFVVFDSETTGLDERRDRIVSIGAVGVDRFQIHMEDGFEAIMPIAYNTSAVTLHGITKELAEELGLEESVAVERFLHYLRDGVIVGHHIRFDVRMLEAAVERHFGITELSNLVVDTMDLTLRLEEMGALPPYESEDGRPDFSLDGLCRRFNIAPHGRHTATGDAFLTAQVFLVLLRRAKKAGLVRLGQLTPSWIPPEER